MSRAESQGTGTILVVDDNAMNRDMLSRRLQREGYSVLCASNGQEGLEMVEQSDIDLILLDILMPDMDGYQVLQILKENPATARLPVIMLTAVHEIDSVMRCLELGVDDYLTKPFNIPFVRSRIATVLHGKPVPDFSGAGESPAAQRRILIVDDNAMNRDMLSRRLQREGYSVLCASNGQEGLEMVEQSDIDLILLDILMPDMDGYQVLQILKENPATARLPVIMLTAVSDVESVKRCIEMGADDYLIKPFNSVLLWSRIEAVIDDKKGEA